MECDVVCPFDVEVTWLIVAVVHLAVVGVGERHFATTPRDRLDGEGVRLGQPCDIGQGERLVIGASTEE